MKPTRADFLCLPVTDVRGLPDTTFDNWREARGQSLEVIWYLEVIVKRKSDEQYVNGDRGKGGNPVETYRRHKTASAPGAVCHVT